MMNKKRKRVVIYGVDDSSISLGKALTMESGEDFNLVGFLSDKPSLKNMRISGVKVIPVGDSLKERLCSLKIDGVMVIGKNLSVQQKNEVVNDSLACGLQVFNAPLVEQWNSSDDITQHIKRSR